MQEGQSTPEGELGWAPAGSTRREPAESPPAFCKNKENALAWALQRTNMEGRKRVRTAARNQILFSFWQALQVP